MTTVSDASQTEETSFKVNRLGLNISLPLVIFFIMSVSVIRPVPGQFLPRDQVNCTLEGDAAAA